MKLPEPVLTPEGARRRVLSYGGTMMMVQFEFPAGVTAAWHNHPHEQMGYIVAGELDFIMEGCAPPAVTTCRPMPGITWLRLPPRPWWIFSRRSARIFWKSDSNHGDTEGQ